MTRSSPDTWYPEFIFLVDAGFLGIGVALGAVIGGLWRLIESRSTWVSRRAE